MGGADPRADPGMQTPLAPLPDPGTPESRAPRPARPFPIAVRAGVRFARRAWRPLLAILVAQILLALTVVVPFQARVAERLDHHAHAPALAGAPDAVDRALGWPAGLDAGLWRDVKRLEASTFDGLAVAFFWVVVVAWLFGAVAAGGFLGTATDEHVAPSAGRFFAHGGRHVGRMLRVGLVFLVVLFVAGRLVLDLWGGAGEDRNEATQSAAWWQARLREGVLVLLFLWLRVIADVARADLVVFARRSAVAAFLRGIVRTLRHPLRTLGLAVVLGVPAFLALLALAALSHALPSGGWIALAGAFVIVQAAVLVRWASRAAVLGGLAHVVGSSLRVGSDDA